MPTKSFESLIKDITQINKIIKDHHIETEINVKDVLQKILDKEKEYSIIKFNLNNSKNNLEDNLKLLKQKCDIEYKIYEILMEHKSKLEQLQKKHNMDIPDLDSFIQNLFNISVCKTKDTKISDKSDKSKKIEHRDKKKLNANILQDQLNAAIMSRRSAINPE